jgi:cell volume regulation protein A
LDYAHHLILIGGALLLLGAGTGVVGSKVSAPVLLIFLAIGMLAGDDGLGLAFNDFGTAYLVGSVALAVILFEGGVKTERFMFRLALWPAMLLATLGVMVTAGILGSALVLIFGASWTTALLIGVAGAPTDAAAVSLLLRQTNVQLPDRVRAVIELESGLNDPMSIFLTVTLVQALLMPAGATIPGALLSFLVEMGGGLAFGLVAGYGLLPVLRWLKTDPALFPVLVLASSLTVFGAAQSLHASGFLAVYLMGAVIGSYDHQARQSIERFFGVIGWVAQIALFLMLGLLVVPHGLVPLILPTLATAAVLILIARPVAVWLCLQPFGFAPREIAFVAWVGLRGAVPIYLMIIPVLAGTKDSGLVFGAAFVIVIMSLVVQGSSVGLAARRLGVSRPAQET